MAVTKYFGSRDAIWTFALDNGKLHEVTARHKSANEIRIFRIVNLLKWLKGRFVFIVYRESALILEGSGVGVSVSVGVWVSV